MAGKGRLRHLNTRQQREVSEAVDAAERATGLQICIYLGPAGEDARAHAEQLFFERGLHTRPAVLVLVAPEIRRLEVLTAPAVRERVSDEAAQTVVDRMTARFADGDLRRGLLDGIEQIVIAAGPGEETGEELPDLLLG